MNLGSGVNTKAEENGPSIIEEDTTGVLTLYFSSTRDTGMGKEDIYVSTAYRTSRSARRFSSPCSADRTAMCGLSFSARGERSIEVGSSGLLGANVDLWTSSRESLWAPWSDPVRMPNAINSTGVDARPVLSFDGTELYFHSNRTGTLGGNDIYVCTRTKITGRSKK